MNTTSLRTKPTRGLRLFAMGLALGYAPLAFGQTAPSPSKGLRLQAHPIGIRLQHQGHSLLGLGLWTQTEQLRGISLAGVMNDHKGNGAGLMLSGLMNRSSRESTFTGVSIAPLLNGSRGDFRGLQIGAINGAFHGRGLVQIGAISGTGDLAGVQLSSFVNLSTGKASGLQLGAVNVAGSARGLVQLGGINAVASELRGVQIGAYNYAGTLGSAQIGLINTIGATAGGVQIGLVNVSREAKTRQIGLMNVLPDTRIQFLVGGGSLTKGNLAVRFRRGRGYSQVGLGLGYRAFTGKFSGSLSYHRGLIFPLSSRLSLLGDLGVAHIEDTPLQKDGEANRRYAFASRLSLEYRITQLLGAYILGGYAYSRRYSSPALERYRPIFEAGITIN